MNKTDYTTRIYLIRHATPDRDRTDLPYDLPPGPPLSRQGCAEASQLAEFIRQKGLKKLYYSPLERTKRTAEIISEVTGISIEQEMDLAEWRNKEDDHQFAARFLPVWNRVVDESRLQGPIGLVTHGGPVRFMLHTLGLSHRLIESYIVLFDQVNPLPPAGVWLAEKQDREERWNLYLVYLPAHP
jgi:broad specificity phosphatase PhoE